MVMRSTRLAAWLDFVATSPQSQTWLANTAKFRTIVANNTAMYTPTCDASRSDGSGNLQWPDDGSPCTDGALVADPMLGELGDNGGDTATMLPSPGSPARGIGHGCPPADQRGNPRGDPCTAGAVEVP